MDGNRRWARSRGMPPAYGHRRGAEAVAPGGRGLRQRGHPLPDPVRLLLGELAPAGQRGRRPDGSAARSISGAS